MPEVRCGRIVNKEERGRGDRGLISVERCVREEHNSLNFYIANSEENLIKGVAAAETINTENTVTSEKFKKQKAQELKQNWRQKKMHGQLIRQWLSKSDLKVKTIALLCAAQEQAIRKNYLKHHIDKTSESSLCKLCGKKGESMQHK